MNFVDGYVYDESGKHDLGTRFEMTADNIALFIMNNRFNPVVVVDETDSFVVSSCVGGFLDRVYSASFRDELLEVILPYQLGDKEIPLFPIKEIDFTIGFNKINIHHNSDYNFDYSIYDNKKQVIDGGIIINDYGLDSIPYSSLELIKNWHKLEGDINV